MTHVMHATHGAKMSRGFLGKFTSLRLHSHCKSLFGQPLSVVSIASFAFRPEGRLCAGGPLQLSFLYDVEGTSVLGGAYNLSLLRDLKDVFVLVAVAVLKLCTGRKAWMLARLRHQLWLY